MKGCCSETGKAQFPARAGALTAVEVGLRWMTIRRTVTQRLPGGGHFAAVT
jgi:hypothetical protein